jgi:hypothetical protein
MVEGGAVMVAPMSLLDMAAAVRLYSIWLPVWIGCLLIVIAICGAAARRKLHIPGYVGIAFVSFVIALILGRMSGSAGLVGTPTGIFISVLFFLLMATALGSIVAIFFYRHPEV